MQRPDSIDYRFAHSSDLTKHAQALEAYASYLEGKVEAYEKTLPAPRAARDENGKSELAGIMDEFFGAGFTERLVQR